MDDAGGEFPESDDQSGLAALSTWTRRLSVALVGITIGAVAATALGFTHDRWRIALGVAGIAIFAPLLVRDIIRHR